MTARLARRVAVIAAVLVAAGPPVVAGWAGVAARADDRPGGHPKVWVKNESGTVWPVDSVTHRAGKPVTFRRCQHFAGSIAITPDGRTVLVACAHVTFTISTATGRVGAAVATGPGTADQVVVAPDGRMAYVASANVVVPVSIRTGKAGKPIVVAHKRGGPIALAVTPDSKTIYAVNLTGVVPISASTGRAGKPLRTGPMNSGIVITPDGRTAYALTDENTIIPISTRTNTAGKPIRIGPDTTRVNALAMSPDGKTVYVADSWFVAPRINIVVPVSTATNKPGRPVKVGIYPYVVAFTPDGKTAFVATENAVYPVFTATGHVGRLIRTTFSPGAIVVAPDGRTAWVTGFSLRGKNFGSGYLLPISTATDRPSKPIRLGRSTDCLTMQPWRRGIALGPSSCFQ